jgi:two-component system phosphate regulon sensor histidine kinase PhoR
LYEVIYNLCDNAIKYNHPGGHINISVTDQHGIVKISVSDSGIGIAPEHQEKIFERFYRLDDSRARETGGTGLGLAIAKEVVTLHGGKLYVEDAENGGSIFVMEFPYNSDEGGASV